MKRTVVWILLFGCFLALVWYTAGLGWAIGALAAVAVLRVTYDRSSKIRTRTNEVRKRVRQEIKEPHPLTPVALGALATLVIVNLATIWDFTTDAFSRPPGPGAVALEKQLHWLREAAGESINVHEEALPAFEDEHARFDLDDGPHERRRPSPQLAAGEYADRRYELIGREVTLRGEIARVIDYQEGVIGLWLADVDQDRPAEATCFVKVESPEAFVLGRRAQIEGIALLVGTKDPGTEYSRTVTGFACARADIWPYRLWSPEELVDEQIENLENEEGWRGTLEDSRQYLIDHYDRYRLDRVHRYDYRGMRQSTIRRLVWSLQSFDGFPVVTWGRIVSTTERPEDIDGERYLLQDLVIDDENDVSSRAFCPVLRPRERPLHTGDWVYATGVPVGSVTAPLSGGGFSNAVQMICSGIQRAES